MVKMDPEKKLSIASGNRELKKRRAPRPLILVILPQTAPDIRKEVKQWGDIETGVPTQCVRADKLTKANNQYCNNVALKSVVGLTFEIWH